MHTTGIMDIKETNICCRPSQRVLDVVLVVDNCVAMIAIGIQIEYILFAAIFHYLKNNWLNVLNARHPRQLVVVIELWNHNIYI